MVVGHVIINSMINFDQSQDNIVSAGFQIRSAFSEFFKCIGAMYGLGDEEAVKKYGHYNMVCLCAARGAGKTYTSIQALVYLILNMFPDFRAEFVTTTLGKAKETVRPTMVDMIRQWPNRFCVFNGQEHSYNFNVSDNDKRKLILKSYDMGEAGIRGDHPHVLLLDETANMPYDLYGSAILPALSPEPERNFKGGKLICIGTVERDSFFRELWHRGLDPNYPECISFSIDAIQSGIFDQSDLRIRKSSMTAEQYAQEYMCDWNARALFGAVYLDFLNRIPNNIDDKWDYDPTLPVWTSWDIGWSDYVSIWFFQVKGDRITFIDFYENNGQHPPFYADVLKRKPYRYNPCILPFDGHVTRFEGDSASIQLEKEGLRTVKSGYATEQSGIDTARLMLSACMFNKSKCEIGLKHLENFRYKINSRTGEKMGFVEQTVHNHAADAFRYFAVSKSIWEEKIPLQINNMESSYYVQRKYNVDSVWKT